MQVLFLHLSEVTQDESEMIVEYAAILNPVPNGYYTRNAERASIAAKYAAWPDRMARFFADADTTKLPVELTDRLSHLGADEDYFVEDLTLAPGILFCLLE